MTRSQKSESALIAAESNVPPDRVFGDRPGGQGRSALSRPMRVDSPAARMIPASPMLLRHFAVQKLAQTAPGAAHADVEMPELCIHSADFVEAHLVNQLLEDQWIVGEQIHAPLPIVEADRAGDDLFDLSGIATAHE